MKGVLWLVILVAVLKAALVLAALGLELLGFPVMDEWLLEALLSEQQEPAPLAPPFGS